MSDETIVVNTNYGPVRGRVRKDQQNDQYYSFQGIPYAEPPVGELRFKDPKKKSKWTEVLDATKPGSPASATFDIKFKLFDPSTSEDCLTLNVYTRNINPIVKRPVMVFIHGGGFVIMSSNEALFGPEFLLQKDIVFVSMNYRLGALGFMSIPDKKHNIPGNAGLKDQALSLRWVRENCHHFGGDPENITIFGISAGGASVHYHLISDYSRGLFDKAIVQSGSGLNAWACQANTNDLTIRLAESLGWNGEGGIDAIVKLLQSSRMEDIVKNQYKISDLELQRGELCGFVPCIEPYDVDGSAFLPKPIPELMKTAWGNQIPIIIGGTSDEGYLNFLDYKSNEKLFDDNGYFVNSIPRYLSDKIGDDDKEERERLGEKIKKFFYGNEKPTFETLDKYMPIATDILFWHGIFVAIKARLQDPNCAPTYLYRFNYNSDVLTSFKLRMTGKTFKGCIHGEDSLYLLHIKGINDNLAADGPEARIKNIFINAWTEFASKGDPKCKELESIDWKPLVKGEMPLKCLNIDDELEFIDLPESERMKFWDTIYNFGF